MAERKVIGYIVTDGRGAALMLDAYDDSPPILLAGDDATLFATRRRANAAIKRSAKYADAHKFDWETYRYRVYPVHEATS